MLTSSFDDAPCGGRQSGDQNACRTLAGTYRRTALLLLPDLARSRRRRDAVGRRMLARVRGLDNSRVRQMSAPVFPLATNTPSTSPCTGPAVSCPRFRPVGPAGSAVGIPQLPVWLDPIRIMAHRGPTSPESCTSSGESVEIAFIILLPNSPRAGGVPTCRLTRLLLGRGGRPAGNSFPSDKPCSRPVIGLNQAAGAQPA